MKLYVIFGLPGSGKGTQATKLCKNYNFFHCSTGDLLRDKTSSLFEKVSKIMSSGELVSDEIVTSLLQEKISKINKQNNTNAILLDGYPRTKDQAILLENLLSETNLTVEKVIYFQASDEIVIERVINRFSCKNCGMIYNKKSKKPIQDGICDSCGSTNFISRQDDNEDSLKKRIKIFHDSMEQILDFYKNKVITIDVSKTEDEIFQNTILSLNL